MLVRGRDRLREIEIVVVCGEYFVCFEGVGGAVQGVAFEHVPSGERGDDFLRPPQCGFCARHLRRNTDTQVLESAVAVVVDGEQLVFA